MYRHTRKYALLQSATKRVVLQPQRRWSNSLGSHAVAQDLPPEFVV